MNKHNSSRRVATPAALAVNLIFYLAFVLHDGPVLCTDSPSYINMDYSREPVYPLFLALLRRLIGTGYSFDPYLLTAVVIQAIIMAVCVWYTAREIGKVLAPIMNEMAGLVLTNGILWGVDLLNRFAAGRGSMYVECIMTESLCIPLYYVFLVKALQWFRTHRRADIGWLFALMLLMTSIRKQSMVTMVILCGFAFLYDLCVRRRLRAFIQAVAAAAVAFVLMTGLDYGYNYALRGVWMHKTDNYKGTACTLLYTATADDAALFEDDGMRTFYEDIYQQMVDQGLTYDSIPEDSDWITRSNHYADVYDVIGYDVLVPTCERYIEAENPDIEKVEECLQTDLYMKEIQDTLLGHEILGAERGRLVTTWIASYANGFVNTVLRKTPLLAAASAVLYALYILGLALVARKIRRGGKELPERVAAPEAASAMPRAPLDDLLLFAFLVAFAIVVNVIVVGTMIFAQTRYMIYNMGFFYIALMGLAAAVLRRGERAS